MTQTETLGVIEEIESLVSDQLQVVSYKWLSRNFLVSSNAAKRLLKEFVEKHSSGLEVVYSLSGWLKNSPSSYHIRLVSGSKLAEEQQDFDGKCSVQVYSVQACIPKDPAALWNAEFVQAEELFKQPSAVDNCLRDNRFCGILNTFVKRNIDGTQTSNSAPQTKSAGFSLLSKSSSSHQENARPANQQKKSLTGLKDVKSENTAPAIHDQSATTSTDKEKVQPLPANRKKEKDGKNSSGAGGSLANLWGRASVKPKDDSALTEDGKVIPNPTEARVSSHEAGGEDDAEEAQDFNIKRASNGDGRKRKVVFDLSDEEFEDAVSLASPDIPKGKSRLDDKQSPENSVPERHDTMSGKTKKNKPNVKEEEEEGKKESSKSLRKDPSIVSKNRNIDVSSLDKIPNHVPEAGANPMDKAGPPTSPKRRKVLKSRIDERGREVTEVVWEGEETAAVKAEINAKKKEDDNTTTKKTENNTATAALNRPLGSKKSPAIGNASGSTAGGKAGNKKGGNVKDPKQGNILSFFKKV